MLELLFARLVIAFFDSIGQTEKNSVRAYVFRFALELGHCSTQSACLKRANNRLMHRRRHIPIRSPLGAGEQLGRYTDAEGLSALRLMTSSNLVGCITGKAAGLAPLRIWPV